MFNCAFGQESLKEAADSTGKFPKRVSFFLELGGTAGFYSVNTDIIFLYRPSYQLSGRLGFFFTGYINSIPLELCQSIGIGNNSFFETGIGIIPWIEKNSKYIGIVTRIGYRYQDPNGGLFLRVGYTPLLFPNSSAGNPIWFGLSLGYTLKN